MSTSLPKWELEIRNAGSTEACLREAIRQIKGLNDMRPHDGLGYEINDVIEVANSIKGKNGNAAAMREALEKITALLGECYNGELYEKADEAIAVADAALAAPPRNCDKYKTPEESIRMFESYIRESWKLGFINPFTEVVKWLFEPAAERKGDK